ncbi:MAG: 30S ribosome-binding factor RbfA [Myxococcota bacterium]|nr:30S ribosome-binding factor RbfA [Myxococcota bacterium]
MGSEQATRVRRVADGVREELASLIAQEVRDPGAVGAIVTRVEMTSDLRGARVHVRLLEGGDVEARRRTVVEALGRASGMLRRELTRRLSLRFAPELRFHYDEGLDKTTRIEELLVEIERERRPR